MKFNSIPRGFYKIKVHLTIPPMASTLFIRAARKLRAPTLISTSLSPFSLLSHLQNPSPLPAPQTLAPPLPPAIHPSIRIAPSTRSPRIRRLFPFELSVSSISSSPGTADERPGRAADGGGGGGGGSPAPAAPAPSWVELYLPASVRPYALLARLDKPIGTWLLAWPCMWYNITPSFFSQIMITATPSSHKVHLFERFCVFLQLNYLLKFKSIGGVWIDVNAV